jgi:hypothetical protein
MPRRTGGGAWTIPAICWLRLAVSAVSPANATGEKRGGVDGAGAVLGLRGYAMDIIWVVTTDVFAFVGEQVLLRPWRLTGWVGLLTASASV